VREFVVTLRDGRRYTVRADRLALLDHETVGLIVDPSTAIGAGGPVDNAVAVFDRRLVASVIAVENLVSEGKAEPVDPPWMVARGDPNSDVPF
jgi:hypothetical protein